MPVKYEPMRSHMNDPAYRPYAPIAAPTAPASAPSMNPKRRPYFCINGEIQGAVVIDPKTMIEIGKVAKQMLEANMPPANPPMTKIMGICDPKIACAITKMTTFRFVRLSSTMLIDASVVLAGESVHAPIRLDRSHVQSFLKHYPQQGP